jgi:hypothetical protein
MITRGMTKETFSAVLGKASGVEELQGVNPEHLGYVPPPVLRALAATVLIVADDGLRDAYGCREFLL